METKQQNEQPETQHSVTRFFFTTFGRVLVIGVITLILLIPLARIFFLIEERKNRSEEVAQKMNDEWGSEFNYNGMVIRVPLIKTTKVPDGQFAFIYPEKSDDSIESTVNEKKRGIYSQPIYQCIVRSKATFKLEQLNPLFDWSKAQIGIITNNDARVNRIIDFKINQKTNQISSQSSAFKTSNFQFLASSFLPIEELKETIQTSVQFSCNGSKEINLQSLAKTTSYSMQSNWNDPSFSGTLLPEPNSLKINQKGFRAEWKKINFGIQSANYEIDNVNPNNVRISTIGFIHLVDQYQLNERTVKYSFLVIILTFAVFFLTELVGKIIIHPIHYLLIGLALILFYALLISFSEQIGFLKAYVMASVSIIGLLFWYAKSVLNSLKFAFSCSLSLTILYTFLLVIVNLETYALIVGSIGLFITLFAIMSFTRRINVTN